MQLLLLSPDTRNQTQERAQRWIQLKIIIVYYYAYIYRIFSAMKKGKKVLFSEDFKEGIFFPKGCSRVLVGRDEDLVAQLTDIQTLN